MYNSVAQPTTHLPTSETTPASQQPILAKRLHSFVKDSIRVGRFRRRLAVVALQLGSTYLLFVVSICLEYVSDRAETVYIHCMRYRTHGLMRWLHKVFNSFGEGIDYV